MNDKKSNDVETSCVADTDAMLNKANEHISKLKMEVKEREAEKAFYLKENEFLKESLRRLIGV